MNNVDPAIFVPNVTRVGRPDSAPLKGSIPEDQGFQKAFEGEINRSAGKDLTQVADRLKFSAHAMERLRSRNISIDPDTMMRIKDAIDRADQKGVQESLVLTDDAALIVSVKNKTVVTAMDRNSLSGNVFTNIDGAVVV